MLVERVLAIATSKRRSRGVLWFEARPRMEQGSNGSRPGVSEQQQLPARVGTRSRSEHQLSHVACGADKNGKVGGWDRLRLGLEPRELCTAKRSAQPGEVLLEKGGK